MKHPTQGLATSRAYIVSDNCPSHIRGCRTPKWKDQPPIKSLLSTHTMSSAVTCAYLHSHRVPSGDSCRISVTAQQRRLKHRGNAAAFLKEFSSEKSRDDEFEGIRGALLRCFQKRKACLWLSVLWVFLMFGDEAQAHWGRDVRESFYWCQLIGTVS